MFFKCINISKVAGSFSDPLHFDVDPDPLPGIRIRVRIRIRLRINVSWSGSGSGQMIRIRPTLVAGHHTQLTWLLFLCILVIHTFILCTNGHWTFIHFYTFVHFCKLPCIIMHYLLLWRWKFAKIKKGIKMQECPFVHVLMFE